MVGRIEIGFLMNLEVGIVLFICKDDGKCFFIFLGLF